MQGIVRNMPPDYMQKFRMARNVEISRLAWLQGLTPSGAVPLSEAYEETGANVGYNVNPYFASLAARAFMLGENAMINCARYIDWFFNHLIADGSHEGLAWTIPDYNVQRDGGHTIRVLNGSTCDSVDSYIACFIRLLCDYCAATGDYTPVISNKDKINGMFAALNSLVGANGLSIAKPSYPVQYLMDNCEVYDGYLAFAQIYERGLPELPQNAAQARNKAAGVAAAVESLLWRPGQQHYDYALGFSTNIVGDFYPNVLCQLAPALYGLIDALPDPESRWLRIIEKFAYYAPSASDLTYYGNVFPACEVMWLTLKKYLQYPDKWATHVRLDPFRMFAAMEYRVANNHYYVYAHDSGWFARSCAMLVELDRLEV